MQRFFSETAGHAIHQPERCLVGAAPIIVVRRNVLRHSSCNPNTSAGPLNDLYTSFWTLSKSIRPSGTAKSAASEELAKQHGKYGNEVAELVSRTKVACELFGPTDAVFSRATLLLFALTGASFLEASTRRLCANCKRAGQVGNHLAYEVRWARS